MGDKLPENASSALSNNEDKQLLLKILQKEQMNNYQIEEEAITEKGDNYMSTILSIKVKDDSKQLHLICKKEIDLPVQRDEIRKMLVFEKESFVYNILLPTYEKLQKDKGLSVNEGFNNYAKCYGTNEGCLFLEDLRHRGYQMSDRFKNPDFDQMKMSIEMLARFHAIGFVLKYQHPEVVKEYRKKIPEMCFRRDYERWYAFVRIALDSALATLDDGEQVLKDKVLDLKLNLEDKLEFCLGQESGEPYATITHGDFWNNNMLYKYENGKLIHACLVDYQLCRYSSPAIDLAYYIFCCTDQQYRDKHYDDILHIYHSSLSNMMHKLGSDSSEVFPYEALEGHMKRFGFFGLVAAAYMLRLIFAKTEDTFDVEKYIKLADADDLENVQFMSAEETSLIYKKQMSNVIRDIVKRGML